MDGCREWECHRCLSANNAEWPTNLQLGKQTNPFIHHHHRHHHRLPVFLSFPPPASFSAFCLNRKQLPSSVVAFSQFFPSSPLFRPLAFNGKCGTQIGRPKPNKPPIQNPFIHCMAIKIASFLFPHLQFRFFAYLPLCVLLFASLPSPPPFLFCSFNSIAFVRGWHTHNLCASNVCIFVAVFSFSSFVLCHPPFCFQFLVHTTRVFLGRTPLRPNDANDDDVRVHVSPLLHN